MRGLYYRPRNSAFILRATRRSDCIFRRREMVQFAGERTQTGKTSVFTRPPPAVRSSSPESNQVSLPRHSGVPVCRAQDTISKTRHRCSGSAQTLFTATSTWRCRGPGRLRSPSVPPARVTVTAGAARSPPPPSPGHFRQDAAARNVGAGTVTLRNPRTGGWPPPTAGPRPPARAPLYLPLGGLAGLRRGGHGLRRAPAPRPARAASGSPLPCQPRPRAPAAILGQVSAVSAVAAQGRRLGWGAVSFVQTGG